MKVISAEKARELRAGNAHFHWVCFDKLNFISKHIVLMQQPEQQLMLM